MSLEHDKLACPSAALDKDVSLLGVIDAQGSVQFIGTPIPVTEEFVQIARNGRSPEKRFRFTTTCAQRGCAQWAGGRCHIGAVVAATTLAPESDALLPCGLRDRCRWYDQEGKRVCNTCRYVVTDGRPEDRSAPERRPPT